MDGMAEDSPLQVLLNVMRIQMAEQQYDKAVAAAKIAAPYVHGRAPLARPGGNLAGVFDDELDQVEWGICDEAGGGGSGAAVAAYRPDEPG